MNSDAAEQVVRMVLNGADITIRLVGAGAKNLAALLLAWSKKEKLYKGKTSLPKLLTGGDELNVITLTKEQYGAFRKLSKKKITFAPFLNTKSDDGKIDIVLGSRQLNLANRILDRIGYGNVEPGSGARPEFINEMDRDPAGSFSFDSPGEDPKKNDTPWRTGSNECRDSSSPRSDRRSRKPSVEKQLEENKRKLQKQQQKDRAHEKAQRSKNPAQKER